MTVAATVGSAWGAQLMLAVRELAAGAKAAGAHLVPFAELPFLQRLSRLTCKLWCGPYWRDHQASRNLQARHPGRQHRGDAGGPGAGAGFRQGDRECLATSPLDMTLQRALLRRDDRVAVAKPPT